MAYLKTYENEWKDYKDLYDKFTDDQKKVKKVIGKLCRHFKIVEPDRIIFTKISNSGKYRTTETGYWSDIILAKENICLGIIAHEFAHHLDKKKYNHRGHTGSFKKSMKRTVNYIRKKNCWNEFITWQKDKRFVSITNANDLVSQIVNAVDVELQKEFEEKRLHKAPINAELTVANSITPRENIRKTDEEYIESLLEDLWILYNDEGKNYSKKQVREMHSADIPIWISEREESQ